MDVFGLTHFSELKTNFLKKYIKLYFFLKQIHSLFSGPVNIKHLFNIYIKKYYKKNAFLETISPYILYAGSPKVQTAHYMMYVLFFLTKQAQSLQIIITYIFRINFFI